MTIIKIIITLLYTVILIGANPLIANDYNSTTLEALKKNDMRLLTIHDSPKPAIKGYFVNKAGSKINISAYAGKIVLVNFWATWCAPCRAEMPALDQLQATLKAHDFVVIPVAIGRNPIPVIETFFTEQAISHLPIFRDPNMAFSRQNEVFGIPVSIILNRNGQEIARLQGEANWASDDAIAIIEKLLTL